MQTQLANNEEKLSNSIMFLYIFAVVVSGFGFVMIFLNGGKRVEEGSGNFVITTDGIGASTEEQVAGLDNIVKSMKNMQAGMERLSGVLHSEK